MRLDRLEVSGGFLDGLRLDFADGLNVLIGARGAGKTSVLELARFGLGVPAITAEADAAAVSHAQAVLGDGTVTLYCSVQGEQIVFSRTGLDDAPSASAQFAFAPPLIISQNEIEAIGLDPRSRREILDRLVDPFERAEVGVPEVEAGVASLERRLERMRDDREILVEQVDRLRGLEEALREAEAEQLNAAKQVAAATPVQENIAELADRLGELRAASDAYRLTEETLTAWRAELAAARLDRPLPKLPSRDVELEVTSGIAQAHELIGEAEGVIVASTNAVAQVRASTRSEQAKTQQALKADTEKLEKLQTGAGEVGRRVSALRQQLKEREGLEGRVAELNREIASVTKARNDALDEASQQGERRYDLRRARASALTAHFNGAIEVRVEKFGEHGAYEQALVSALQGSNLQYKALAPELARRMSPRELVESVETGDAERVSRAAHISSDRAVRLVAHLSGRSLAELLLAPLDDAVDFALLDGQEYKPTRDLSMGQRCTVVLPLLLAEEREAILLDQPEDHLDNAFIVDTLVEAVRERAAGGQVIVATHNANIPVLGEASQIVVLASDGRHGFATTVAPLDDDAAVQAITTLMEGGREAFARRAAFYDKHDHAE